MESELLIKIRSALEGAGLTAADSEIERLAATTKKADKSTKDLGESGKEASEHLHKVGESAHGTQEIMEGLARAQAGGVEGFLGLIKGVRGFISVARGVAAGALPFAGVVTAIAAVAAVALSMKDNFRGAGEEIEGAKTKTNDLNTSLAQLKADKADSVALQIKKIEDSAKSTIDRLTQLEGALNKLSGNQLAIRKDKIAADQTLSPAQKDRAVFDAENKEAKEVFDRTQKSNQGKIDADVVKYNAQIPDLQESVRKENELRQERDDIKNSLGQAKEDARKAQDAATQKFRREAGGGLVPDGPAPTKEAENKALELQSVVEEMVKRLAKIEGTPGKDDGELGTASAETLKRSAAADVARHELFGKPDSKEDIGSVAIAKQNADLDAANFATEQTHRNNEFAIKQTAELKKLSDERTTLVTEKSGLEEKNLRAGLGGDPAANARLEEIKKRLPLIDTEAAQRNSSVPSVKDNNAKLTKDLNNKFDGVLSGISAEAVSPSETKRAGSIVGPDGKVHAINRDAGKGSITDSQGNAVALDKLTKPGEGKATRETASVATVDLSPATISAIAAAIKSAGVGSGAPTGAKDIAAAADKSAKSTDALTSTVVKGFESQASRNQAGQKKLDDIARQQRARDDRS